MPEPSPQVLISLEHFNRLEATAKNMVGSLEHGVTAHISACVIASLLETVAEKIEVATNVTQADLARLLRDMAKNKSNLITCAKEQATR